MRAGWAWARSELRRHRGGAVALILLIGVSGAVVLTVAAGSRRSGSAFERFLDSVNTADAQLQYTSQDPALDAAVLDSLRADPAVEVAAPLFITVAFDGKSGYDSSVFTSSERELLHTIDGVRILEGRLPDAEEPHEVTINRFTQDVLGVEVGDTVAVGTFSRDQFTEGEPEGEPEGPTIDLEVVGIHVSPYDLADPEFSGFFGTPAFHDEYGGVTGGFGPVIEVATRDGADPEAVIEKAISRFDLEEVDVSPSSQQTDRVSDGTRVLAVGLAAFAGAAALAAAVACVQALHRRAAAAASDLPALRAIGFTRRQCATAVGLLGAPVMVAGIVVAVVLAVAASPSMPIGIARQAEPDKGIDLDIVVLGVGTLGMAAVLLIATAASGFLLTRQAFRPTVTSRRTGGRSSGRYLRAPLAPPSQLGVAMALDPGAGPRAVPVRSALFGAVFGVAGIVGSVTFGAGLDLLVGEPESYGWNWTFAPDVSSDDGTTIDALVAAPDVEEIGVVKSSQILVNDRRATAVSVRAEEGAPSLSVSSGRMPVSRQEVAVGPKTAEELGVGIGDSVEVGSEEHTEKLEVVGTVLSPTFDDNPFNEGVALSPAAHDALAASDGSDRVIVTFADGVSAADADARMRVLAPGAMSVYAYPSAPPDVENLRTVRFLPSFLGVFLSLLAMAAIGHAVATGASRRRRDFGIVRSLGFVARQVRHTVSTQSITLVTVGLLVGIPIGIVLGHLVWKRVADSIGVTADASAPPLVLVVVAVGGLIAAALLAVVPGRIASRRPAIDALRAE